MSNMVRKTKKYGSIYVQWIGIRPQLMVSDLELITFLLSSVTHIEKNANYDLLVPWLGTGLLITGGKQTH